MKLIVTFGILSLLPHMLGFNFRCSIQYVSRTVRSGGKLRLPNQNLVEVNALLADSFRV